MASLGDLFITVGAEIGGFSVAMGDVNDTLKKSAREAKTTSAGWSDMFGNMQKIGMGLTATVTAPLIGMGVLATKSFNDFELGMRQVTSLMGNTTQGEFKALSAQTLELSKRLGIDAVKAAKGLYEAISAGIPKENALSFMEVASKAAIAGVTDTKVAVDGLTSIMNAYKLETSKTQVVADAMFQAVNIGKFTFEQLAGSISVATPLASKLGVSFQDLLGAAASMTKQGFSVSEAMASIRSAMVALISPNTQMSELFKKMGVTSGEALIKTDGLQGAMVKLEKAAGGSTQKLSEALGRVEALGSVLALTGDNAKQDGVDIASIGNSTGAATKAFDEINKSSSRTFDQMQAQVKAAAISFGEQLKPALENVIKTAILPLIGHLENAVKWFAQLGPSTQTAILGFAAVAAAAGPLLVVFGTLGQSIIAVKTAAAVMGITLSGLMTAIPWVALTAAVLTLAKAISDLHAAEDAMAKAGDDQSRSIAKLEAHLKSLGVALPEVSKFYRDGTMSGEMYAKHLIALAKAHGDTVESTEAHTAATKKHAAAVALTAEQIKAAADALKHAESVLGVSKINTAEATAAYNLLHAAWNAGKITSIELQKAYDTLQQRLLSAGKIAADVVTPAWIALGQAQEKAKAGAQIMLTAMADWINAGESWGKKIKLATIAHDDLGFSMKGSKLEAADLAEALMVLSGKYPKVEQAAVDMNKAIKGGILETAAIMRSVGVKSQEEYRTEVTKLEQALKDIQKQQRAGQATTLDVARVEMALLKARIEAHDELTDAEKKHYQQLKIMLDPVKALDSAYRTMLTSIKSAFKQLEDDVARGIARSIVAGENLGAAFKNILMNIAEDIITILIKGALAELTKSITGIGGSLGGLKIPGLGGGSNPSTSMPGMIGGLPTPGAEDIAKYGSAASGAVASSLSGWIGAIGSAATAVSSIVGNFQNMAMNKSLDLIEHETRFSQLHLLHLLENSNQWWPKLNHLVDVWGAIGDLPARLQEQFSGGFAGVTAAGGGGVTFQINGGYFLSSRALDEFMEEVIRRLKQRNA